MEYRRTAVIKLDTPDGADSLLRETVDQFKHCANTASEWCWHGRRQIPEEPGCQPETRRVSGDDDGNHATSKAKAERALYDQLRDETELTANLVQKGIRRAVEAIKSGVSRLERGESTSRPQFSADSAVYDKRSATFHRDHVSLSTPDGRVECDYILPDGSETPPTKYVSDDRDTSAYPRLLVSDECSDTPSEPRSEQAGVKRTLRGRKPPDCGRTG